MRALIVLATCALLFPHSVWGAPTPAPSSLCQQERPLIRKMWQQGAFDAPPAVSATMLDAIEGKLPELRQQLAEMKPADAARWRQVAMLSAAHAGQSSVVDALLNDGADVNGKGWIPAYKPAFFGSIEADMKHDAHFGGAGAVDGMAKAGLLENRGDILGPALPTAVSCGDVETVDVLLRHHADVMAREAPNVADALDAATVQGDAAIVRRLLDHGANACVHDRLLRERMRNDPELRERATRRDFTLAAIGRRAGLPADLTARLICPVDASTH